MMKNKFAARLVAALTAATAAVCAAVTPATAAANNTYQTTVKQIEAFTASYQTYWRSCEMQKYPAGKYWNSSNPDSYTNSPCVGHNPSHEPCSHVNAGSDYEVGTVNIVDLGDSTMCQCAGFARKLAQDFFGVTNAKGVWLYYGKPSKYTLRVGDQVRVSRNNQIYHTVFITEVNGNNVKFADCNANDDCKIRWNISAKIENSGKNLRFDGKLFNIEYFFRPPMMGDINGDSKFNLTDVNALLRLTDPNTYGEYSYKVNPGVVFRAADLNNDGKITTADWKIADLQYRTSNYTFFPSQKFVQECHPVIYANNNFIHLDN